MLTDYFSFANICRNFQVQQFKPIHHFRQDYLHKNYPILNHTVFKSADFGFAPKEQRKLASHIVAGNRARKTST